MAEVRMPKMGDGMEEGTIVSWRKREGDSVKEGEMIAEIETDKATVDIVAYETGVLSKIVVPEGGTVPVGEIIAVIGEMSASGNGAHAPAPVRATVPTPVPVPILAPSAPPLMLSGERVKASPLARRMAQELNIPLASVAGTGPGGVIKRRDIEAYQKQSPSLPPMPLAPVAVAAPSTTTWEDLKPSRMRDAIAKRTLQSKQNIPHFYVTMVIEMDKAQALLKELNADAPDGKITVNDIIVKACAVALGRVPEVNSTWTAEGMVRRYREAHIGVAVGIEDGLIIPVVRDCHAKTLRQISADAKGLIGKARSGQLTPAEYSGGTFSISNLGMMGVDEFLAIINPPEAAILAIGGIVRTPVVGENDAIQIKALMKVALSADHRLLDGVTAARFLQEVQKLLEAPFSLVS